MTLRTRLNDAKLSLYLQYIMYCVYISEIVVNLCLVQRGDRLKLKVILIHKER